MNIDHEIWSSFRKGIARDDEWSSPSSNPPLTYVQGSGPCERLYYMTKPILFKRLLPRARFPGGIAAFVRYGLVPSRYSVVVKETAIRLRLDAPVAFVGDLDPYDLSVFLSLHQGSPSLKRRTRYSPPIAYLGINDEWLDRCVRLSRPEVTRPEQLPVCIRMTDFERRHVDVLLRAAPQLRTVIGEGASALLERGYKLELEGASAPRFFEPGFFALRRKSG